MISARSPLLFALLGALSFGCGDASPSVAVLVHERLLGFAETMELRAYDAAQTSCAALQAEPAEEPVLASRELRACDPEFELLDDGVVALHVGQELPWISESQQQLYYASLATGSGDVLAIGCLSAERGGELVLSAQSTQLYDDAYAALDSPCPDHAERCGGGCAP